MVAYTKERTPQNPCLLCFNIVFIFIIILHLFFSHAGMDCLICFALILWLDTLTMASLFTIWVICILLCHQQKREIICSRCKYLSLLRSESVFMESVFPLYEPKWVELVFFILILFCLQHFRWATFHNGWKSMSL